MIREAIERLTAGGIDAQLTERDAERVAQQIMDGAATPAQIAAFLALLRARGETVECLIGFVRAMRRNAIAFPRPQKFTRILDTCGTGGDRAGTYNISTAAALIVASAGVPVAKHGNRSVSSLCGSADLIAALGIELSPAPAQAADVFEQTGFCFLFAPTYHPAMRHAAPARREIGIRTLFNLCGPLSNPAGVTHQIIGVPDADIIPLVAEALRSLGIHRALIVHGSDRLDEITPSSVTTTIEITTEGKLHHDLIDPAELGITPCNTTELAGGDAAENARILEHEIFANQPGPRTDAAILNAGAAFWITGEAIDIPAGMELARQVLRDGRPLHLLRELRRLLPPQPKTA